MKISTRARYGLRLLVDLAEHSGKDPVKLKDISQRQGISLNYLRQLIMPLESNKIVRSIRGNRGGYLLGKKPEEINLLDIMNLLEGPIDLVDCVHNKNLCKYRIPVLLVKYGKKYRKKWSSSSKV